MLAVYQSVLLLLSGGEQGEMGGRPYPLMLGWWEGCRGLFTMCSVVHEP